MSKPSRKQKNPLRQPSDTPASRMMIPHSNAWFAALLAIDPRKALLSGAIVDKAGHLEMCSVCGDIPALIYDALDAPYLPLRLCDDCVEIRTIGLGERLQRRPGHS